MKIITSLNRDPFTIDLMDRKCSLFIDSDNILIDQGNGEDRINGVSFNFTNNPFFFYDLNKLFVHYCGVKYDLGFIEETTEVHSWIHAINSFIQGVK